ncbi:MAG: S-layer homology domain-containing protein [Chloroflexota bacterium]|nr:S-layer homology domain-containing protein [Chloroflexota bacterium]
MDMKSPLRKTFSGISLALLVGWLLVSGLLSEESALAAGRGTTGSAQQRGIDGGMPSAEARSAPSLITSNQFYAAMAFNLAANQYLVVWEDMHNGALTPDLYGQLLAGDGSPIGTNFAISTAPNSQSSPRIAYSSVSNTYMVVWHDLRAGGNNWDIYGQRVSGSDGSLLGSNFPIFVDANAEVWPSIAYSPQTDQFLVAWHTYIGQSSNVDVFARFVSPAGTVNPATISIAITGNEEKYPWVAYDPDAGQFLVLWAATLSNSNMDIQGQLVNNSGVLQGNVINVTTNLSRQYAPTADYNPVQKQWFVAWVDERAGVAVYDIYGQLLNGGTGVLQGGNFPISTSAVGELIYAVSYNISTGRYMVLWDNSYEPGPWHVSARLYEGDGTPVAAAFPVLSTAQGYNSQDSPAVAPMTNPAGFMVVFNNETSGGDYDVWGQRVGHDGRLFGSSLPIAPLPDLLPVPTTCSIDYSDVPAGSTFYSFVRCLACRNVLSGYADGTFKPGNNVTRAQLSKIVSNAAGFSDAPLIQIFQDIQPGSDFYNVIERLAVRGVISGYACNSAPDMPCILGSNRPYFRPGDNASRGQIAKIISQAAGYQDPTPSHTFQDVPASNPFFSFVERLVLHKAMSGYICDNAGLPCVAPGNLPYFKVGDNATRGQISKIVGNTFFPACQTP